MSLVLSATDDCKYLLTYRDIDLVAAAYGPHGQSVTGGESSDWLAGQLVVKPGCPLCLSARLREGSIRCNRIASPLVDLFPTAKQTASTDIHHQASRTLPARRFELSGASYLRRQTGFPIEVAFRDEASGPQLLR